METIGIEFPVCRLQLLQSARRSARRSEPAARGPLGVVFLGFLVDSSRVGNL